MKAVLRLEIIIERALRDQVLDILSQAGCQGWSILPVISGQGHRGARGLEGLSGALENEMILTALEEPQLPQVMTPLRPLLKRWGGVCMVSEAQWLQHQASQGDA